MQWFAAYEAALSNGASVDEAKVEALKAATTARAVAGAVASGATRTAKRSDLRAIAHGEPKRADARKAKPPAKKRKR